MYVMCNYVASMRNRSAIGCSLEACGVQHRQQGSM